MPTEPHVPLVRRFVKIPQKLDASDEHVDFSLIGFSRGETWDELASQYRIVILADAGAGKTHEMKNQARSRRETGHYAFFVPIENMLHGPTISFDIGTEAEYRQWQSSSDQAWFFLDSVDEARLDSPQTFDRCIRRFGAEIHDTMHRAHVISPNLPNPGKITRSRGSVRRK